MVDVAHRLITAGDVAGTVALMQRIGVHFVGSKSPRVLEAVARDGVTHPDEVVIALATSGADLCGLVVAFTERARYWRHFAWRHPIAAAEIAKHRLRRTLRRRAAVPPAGSSDRAVQGRALLADRLSPPTSEQWSDESPRIAKVMYVAVDPSHRRGGLGTELYRWFFWHLRDAQFARCDAHVSADNLPAITLHKRFPFRFVEIAGGYFLWLRPDEVRA